MRALRGTLAGLLALGLGLGLGLGPWANTGFKGTAYAELRYDSNVRKAAIARMQEKLGTLRGTIRPGSPDVRLTEQMIELLAPIRARNGVVEARPATPVSSNASASLPKSQFDRTHTASTEPDLANSPDAGSSDARRILAAVEEMMRNDR